MTSYNLLLVENQFPKIAIEFFCGKLYSHLSTGDFEASSTEIDSEWKSYRKNTLKKDLKRARKIIRKGEMK